MGSTHLILYDISQLLTISTPTMDISIIKDSWADGRRRRGLAFSFQVTHLMQYSRLLTKPFTWVIYLMWLSRADKWETTTEEFDEIIKCKDKMLNWPPKPENSSSFLVKSLPTEHRYYTMLSCHFFVYSEEVPAAHLGDFPWVNSIKHLQMDLWKPRDVKHNKDKKTCLSFLTLLQNPAPKNISHVKIFPCDDFSILLLLLSCFHLTDLTSACHHRLAFYLLKNVFQQ